MAGKLNDERILLASPAEIKPNDRLQRNGDAIVAVENSAAGAVVKTRWATKTIPLDEPVYVWRLVA